MTTKPWEQNYGSDASDQLPWERSYGVTPEPKKPEGYTARKALTDTAISAGQGTAGLIGAAGALVDSATGGRVSRALAPAESAARRLMGLDDAPKGITQSAEEVSAALQAGKSAELQQSEQDLAQTQGFLPAAAKVLSDPKLLLSQAGQQIPIVAATMRGARGGAAAGAAEAEAAVAARTAAGRAPSAAAAERLSRMASARGAEQAVLGTATAMGGGFSAQQAITDVMAMPEDALQRDPEYVALVGQGYTPAEARQLRAYAAGRAAAPIGALANLAAGKLTSKLEAQAFTGNVPGGGVSGLLSAQGARRVAGAVGREALEETVTEGAENLGSNFGVAQVDPNQDLMQGVPEAAGAAGVMGGLMGGGIQAVGTVASGARQQREEAQGERAAAAALTGRPQPAVAPQQHEVVDVDPAAGPLSKAVATDAAEQTGSPVVSPVRVITPVAPAAAVQAAEQAPQSGGLDRTGDAQGAVKDSLTAQRETAPAPATAPAAPVTDEQIRATLQQRAGTIIDAQAIRGIAASLGVPVNRVALARRAMRSEERATAATAAPTTKQESRNADATADPQPDGRPDAGIDQRPASAPPAEGQGRQEGQRQEEARREEGAGAGRVDGRQESPRRQEAGEHAPDDARGARGGRVLDQTPEQLDGDILPPSGSPFSIRGAAEMAARRAGDGAQVIELSDGGFVVRTPKEVPREAGRGRIGEDDARGNRSAIPEVADRPGGATAMSAAVADAGNDRNRDGGTESGAAAEAAGALPAAVGSDPGAQPAPDTPDQGWTRSLKAARAAADAAGVDWKGKGLSKLVGEVKAKRGSARQEPLPRREAALKFVRDARAAGATKPDQVRAGISGGRAFNTEWPGMKRGQLDVDGERFSLRELWNETEPSAQDARAAKPSRPRAGGQSEAAPDGEPNAQRSPSAPASGPAAVQGSEAGERASSFPVDKSVEDSTRNGEQTVNEAQKREEKHRKIDEGFAANREAIKREGFKKGEEVEFTVPGPFTNDDGTVDQERVYRGTIGNLGDKEQAVVRVDIPGRRGVADYHVPATRLRRPGAQAAAPDAKQAPRAGKNTVFTADAADAARKLLKSKLTQLNSGVDPEMLQAGITLAGYHIEKGARTFAAYARAMVSDLGDAVKPYLKSWYMGVKYDPRAAAFKGMDAAADVEAADVENLDDRRQNGAARAAADAAEDPQAEIARLRAERDAARAEADTDALTGLKNRRALDRDGADETRWRAELDLSLFKGYNTLLTDKGGDAVLKAFGEAMREIAPTAAYRRGGDEFALLADSEADAQQLVAQLQRRAGDIEMVFRRPDGKTYTITGVPFTSGVGQGEQSALLARERGKPAGDRNALPGNVREAADDAGRGTGNGSGSEAGQRTPEAETRLTNNNPQEAENGRDSDAAPSAADGEAGVEGTPAGEARGADGNGRAAELRGPDGEVAAGKDRAARRPRARAEGARLADRKGAGDQGDSGRSDRAGVGGFAVDGKPGSRNYSAPAGSLTRTGSWLVTAERNVEAMALALKLDAEGRLATPAEQQVLARYVGFGASDLANKLFPKAAGSGRDYNPSVIQAPAWRAVGEKIKATLSGEQIETLMRSTQYAHFTSEDITRGIWNAITRMGFTGGKVFEPGMGHGNFPMTAPADIKDAIAYTGIEMDHLTALIGRQLVQGGLVLRADFTKQKMPNDSFDIAIGNPPFSQTVITADPDYRKQRFRLHDYFFAKTIDKVRPGGLLAFVTSAGTMNKGSEDARRYIADRADLLGAVRLPDTAFLQNAGTEVVTDIIFLRKRLPGEEAGGEEWMKLEEIQAPTEGGESAPVLVNEYFVRHPEMVIGEHQLIGSRYSDKKYNVRLREGEELPALLGKALGRLPSGIYTKADVRRDRALNIAAAERDLSPDNHKEGGLYLRDGKVMVTRNGAGVDLSVVEQLKPREVEWVADSIGLRDALKQTLSDQRANNAQWPTSLRALDAAYQAFVAKHGPINAFTESERIARYYVDDIGEEVALKDGQEPPEGYAAQERTITTRRYKNKRLLSIDVESPLLMALEVENENGEMVGARQLKERSIAPPAEPKIESTADALLVSLNRRGFLDVEEVAELAGVSTEQAIADLGDRIYQSPIDGSWTMADAYLSGDVVTALEEAEAAARRDPAYVRNVDALRAVQPRKLLPREITVNLGATWISNDVVNRFASEVLGLARFGAAYNANSGQWNNLADRMHSSRREGEFGHSTRSPAEILDAVLNNREIKITKTVNVGGKKSTQTDVESTTAVNEIAKRMRARFQTWVWEDADRAKELSDLYNSLRNRTIPRTFNGDFIDPPGLAMMYRPDSNGRGGLHPHQKRAIWRQVQMGTTYLHHAVGAGKTLEMIIGGMEQKRLGLISKPMYTVPNHVLGQFASEFLEAYPTANIMVADEDTFTGDRRRQFIAQATVNNPDAIIISHSAMRLLRVKPETMSAVVDDMILDLKIAIDDVDDNDRIGRKKLEQQLEALQQKVEVKLDNRKQDDVVFFEDIGVDFLYVDEAHEFRKLDFVTNRTNVKGITPQGSAKSLDLFAKTSYLNRQRPGRSHVFASGTAVTNTMGELFTVEKFMDYEGLRQAGLHHFDAWASEYGQVVTEYERNAAGQYKPVDRFARFDNIPELMQRVLERMDVLTSAQLGGLVKRPDIDGGKPQMLVAEPSDDLLQYMQGFLAERIERSLKWKPSPSQPHNPDPMLAIIGDARLAVIDMRFVDPTAPNDPNSKLNVMIDAIAQRYHEFAEVEFPGLDGKGATQIVFSPIGFGDGVAKSRGFDARAWMLKRLGDQGVPRDQVAFMGDYKTNRKRKALFREMRAGRMRVLVGSPANMGTGVNVQNRLRALHFLSPPWFPSDVEQPHGRILRQGNLNPMVELLWYVTEGTYDSTGWGMVARKGRFIEQVFRGDADLRSAEDLSEVSQYALASALASGDDRAIRVAELESDMGRLQNLRRDHENGVSRAMSDVSNLRRRVESLSKKLESTQKAVADLADVHITPDNFSITLNGRPVPGNSRAEIALAYSGLLRKAIPGAARLAVGNGFAETIGHLQGRIPIYVTARPGAGSDVYVSLGLQAAEGLDLDVFEDMLVKDLPSTDTGALGLSTRMMNKINDLPALPAALTTDLAEARDKYERAQVRAQAPFPQERELFEKTAELARLQEEMANGASAAAAEPEAEEVAAAAPVGAASRPEPERPRDPRQFIVGPIDLRRRVERTMSGWRGDIPTVRVVESASKLPDAARLETGWEKAEGWYDGRGTIYLVSNNIANLTRGDQVLAHEAFGHYGVEGVVGKEQWAQIIEDVAKLRKDGAKMPAAMKAAMASTERRYGTQNSATFAREFLAVMAERGVQSGLMGRVLGAVRRWLRAMGWKTDLWAADEVREIVAKGMRQVRDSGAGPRPGSGRGTAMSAPERNRQTDTPAFKAWFGESKVVDANGDPLIVNHATWVDFEAFDFNRLGENTEGNASSAELAEAAKIGSWFSNRDVSRDMAAPKNLELFLSIENPKKYASVEEAGRDALDSGGAVHLRERLERQGYDGLQIADEEFGGTSFVAFRATQIKSATGNRGTFDSTDPRMAFSLQDPNAASDAIVSRFKEPGNGIVDRIKGKLEDWKPATLGVLTLRQLAEVADSYLPEGSAYVDLMTRMATRRNVLQAESADVAQKWEKMQRDDRRKATAAEKAARITASDRTVDLMHDATLAGTDPAEAYRVSFIRLTHNGDVVSLDAESGAAAIARIESKLADKDWAKTAPDAVQNTMRGDIARIRTGMETEAARAAAHPALVRRWNALPPAWQALYREVRDAYSDRAKAFQDAMLAQVEALEIADREKAALRTRVRNHFEAARVEAPYFPLARFGEFWASVEKPGKEDGETERQFIMAESQRDRDRMIAEAEREGWKLAKKGRKIENIRAQDGASGAFVSDVISTLGAAGVGEKVKDAVYQLYLRTLPDLSTRKQFIHRKKVAGYDADALRAFAGQMNHGAHQLARLEFSQKLGDTVTALEKSAKALQDEASDDADRASAAVNEFKRRHDWVMNPTTASWVQKASAMNFAFYLGISPAAAAVNITQTAIISYPALAARYGWGKALTMTAAAMRDSVRTFGNIERTLKNDDERRAYQQLVDMGAIDVTQAHDLAGLGDSPTQDYNARLHRAMNVVSFLFHKAEVFNREATGIAAYRLAREAGESHAAALKRAEDTIWQTHYDYSNANRARFMQGNAAKVLFAFKQYSQNTTYYLWRAFYESMKGETPEVRSIARQRLVGTLGMTALFSGAMGLPLMSMMFGIANAMAAMFGDDDEPWDAETEFRNFLADILPPPAARIVTGGLVEGGLEAAGLPAPEIGSRTSLNDLWFRAPDQEMEGRDLWHYILEQVAGPIGGIFGGGISGASMIGDGLDTGDSRKVWRGFEQMLPKPARDAMKAIRYEVHGVETLRGDKLIDDAGVMAGIYQLMGFSPAQVAEQYAANSAVKGYEEKIMGRRQTLIDAYALAMTERDPDALRAAVGKIRDFNRANPTVAVTVATLKRSLASRAAYSEKAVNGIVVNPKLRETLSDRVRFALGGEDVEDSE